MTLLRYEQAKDGRWQPRRDWRYVLHHLLRYLRWAWREFWRDDREENKRG